MRVTLSYLWTPRADVFTRGRRPSLVYYTLELYSRLVSRRTLPEPSSLRITRKLVLVSPHLRVSQVQNGCSAESYSGTARAWYVLEIFHVPAHSSHIMQALISSEYESCMWCTRQDPACDAIAFPRLNEKLSRFCCFGIYFMPRYAFHALSFDIYQLRESHAWYHQRGYCLVADKECTTLVSVVRGQTEWSHSLKHVLRGKITLVSPVVRGSHF